MCLLSVCVCFVCLLCNMFVYVCVCLYVSFGAFKKTGELQDFTGTWQIAGWCVLFECVCVFMVFVCVY